MTFRFPLVLALAVAAAFPAGAEPASPEGAQKLTETFASYLGTYAGAVTVTPQGDSYEVKIDATGLMAGLKEKGATGSVAPMTLTLTDMGDGKWNVSQEGPIAIAMEMPGLITFDLKAESQKWSGVFDENLKAFATSEGEMTGLTLNEVVTQPGQPEMKVLYSIDRMTMASSATAGAAGGVDGVMQYTVNGLDETFTLPPTEQMPMPMDINIKVETYAADAKVATMRSAEIMDLWAWFVAHPDKAAVEADFDAMKEKIRTALPLFDTITANGTMTNLTGTTPFGALSAEAATVEIGMNGVKSDGKLHEKIALSGLKLPTEVMPPWVPPFLPDALTFDFTVDSFNLSAPAQILLDTMKPGEKPSPEVNAQLMQAFLPDGAVHLNLAPTGISSDMYNVSVEGDIKAGPAMPMPVGSAFVKVTGLDAVMTALQSAPPEVSQQAIPGIMMARGMAKNDGPDSYSWDIQMGEGGKVTVNGVDMSGMGGGAQ
jgi:hypothetical protein